MAEGLRRMLSRLGVRSEVFYSGLQRIQRATQRSGMMAASKRALRTVARTALIAQLRRFDAVVITGHMPAAFMRGFWDDDLLRASLPETPIVLYDLVYLPTRGDWIKWLKVGNANLGIPDGNHYGMERYDWYLAASAVSEYPMPAAPQPLSIIGMNLDDGTLYPDQKDVTALLDFERTDHQIERDVQLRVLNDIGMRREVLSGTYPIDAIRSVYRRIAVYFIAHRESFGVPICELQACGSYVFTPYSDWVPSHWMKSDLHQPGRGDLTANFVVYRNDPFLLSQELRRVLSSYDGGAVRGRLLREQPALYYGDHDQLGDFIGRLRTGRIHAKSHVQHAVCVNESGL
jgi:hypothetical protein